jgi:hypothetical protein
MPNKSDVPEQRMTRKRFEALLFEVRNGATSTLVALLMDEDTKHDAVIADVRAVWHTAEIALGVLCPGYVPTREALDDLRRLLAWIDDENKEWPSTD